MIYSLRNERIGRDCCWQDYLKYRVSFVVWHSFVTHFQALSRDRFIEFGTATMFVWIVILALGKIPNVPESVITALIFPLYLLGTASIWRLLQQGYRALRRRKARSAR